MLTIEEFVGFDKGVDDGEMRPAYADLEDSVIHPSGSTILSPWPYLFQGLFVAYREPYFPYRLHMLELLYLEPNSP